MVRAIWILAALLFVYAGAYLSLVKVRPLFSSYWVDIPYRGEPEYRIGGESARIVFQPIHAIDKKLRPDFWWRSEEEVEAEMVRWATPWER